MKTIAAISARVVQDSVYGGSQVGCPQCHLWVNAEHGLMSTPNDMSADMASHFQDVLCDKDCYYCTACRVLWSTGCTHSIDESFCQDGWNTDIIKWAAFVTRFTLRGETHEGMPWFDNAEEVATLLPEMKIVFECVCGNCV